MLFDPVMHFDKEMVAILAVSAISGGLFYLVAALRLGVLRNRQSRDSEGASGRPGAEHPGVACSSF